MRDRARRGMGESMSKRESRGQMENGHRDRIVWMVLGLLGALWYVFVLLYVVVQSRKS